MDIKYYYVEFLVKCQISISHLDYSCIEENVFLFVLNPDSQALPMHEISKCRSDQNY